MAESTVDVDRLRELMSRYQGGELEAFAALYAALAPPLLAYLTALARDGTRAEDLLQESFLQMHRSRHTYRTELPVRPWAFAIARHVWLMDLRTRRRRPRADAELPEIPVAPEAFGLADRETLARALGAVRAERREALLLHHLWGFSFAEIGGMLGIRADAAKLRSSRGMADLRALLAGDRR